MPDLNDEEKRLIDKAKQLLISYGMTEPQAHRYILHAAMSSRRTKVWAAGVIVETLS